MDVFSVVKTCIPKFVQSYVIYQVTYVGCNACYIGKTKGHLETRIEEHVGKDKNLQILKHLQESPHFTEVSDFDCFDVIFSFSGAITFRFLSQYFFYEFKRILNVNTQLVINFFT